jgi:hypothetical protein
MRILGSGLRRVALTGVAMAVLFAVTGTSPVLATVDADLESGLAYLVSGNNALAAQHLARFGERQGNPEIRRQINMTIARLDQLQSSASREQAARELKSIALDWRYRNFPVFP